MPLCHRVLEGGSLQTTAPQPTTLSSRTAADLWNSSYQDLNISSLNASDFILNSPTSSANQTILEQVKISEMQIVKVVVLITVVGILLMSSCRFVLKLFSRYIVVGKDERDISFE